MMLKIYTTSIHPPRILQATVYHPIKWKMRHLLELKKYQGALSFQSESERKKSLDWWAPNLLSSQGRLPGGEALGHSAHVLTPFSLERTGRRTRPQADSTGPRIYLFHAPASGPVPGFLSFPCHLPRGGGHLVRLYVPYLS